MDYDYSEHISDAAEAPGVHARYVGGATIAFLALAIPVLVSMLALAIAPGILQMASDFGAITAQLVMTLPAVVMMLGAALAGYFSERWGRRSVIVTALAIYAVSGVAGFAAGSLAILVVTRVVIGFAGGILLTTIYAIIGEYYEGTRRERLLGFMSMTASIASLAMLALMGFVVEAYGWRAPFLFYPLSLLLIPFALSGLHKGKAAASAMLSWQPVLKMWPIYLLLTSYTIGMYMMVIQGPFLLNAKGVTAPSTIGQFVAISSLVGAFGGGIYGLMRQHLGFRAMFVFISLAIGIGLPFAAWAPPGPMFIMAMVVVGLGIGIIEPTVASQLLLKTPEPLHDRAMGVNVAAMFLGQFLNPFVVAPLSQVGGIVMAFNAIGIAYLGAGILFLLAMARMRDARASASWI